MVALGLGMVHFTAAYELETLQVRHAMMEKEMNQRLAYTAVIHGKIIHPCFRAGEDREGLPGFRVRLVIENEHVMETKILAVSRLLSDKQEQCMQKAFYGLLIPGVGMRGPTEIMVNLMSEQERKITPYEDQAAMGKVVDESKSSAQPSE